MCSVHTDPKDASVEMQYCLTLAGCSLKSIYQLAGHEMTMLMTYTEPQPDTRGTKKQSHVSMYNRKILSV